jgi:hypothetical protein
MTLISFHPVTTDGIHPEPKPEPASLPSAHDADASLPHKPVNIVPGGDGVFALPPISTMFSDKPAVASSTVIHLEGAPNEEYRIDHPHSTSPQWATALDPETGGPSSERRQVQQSDKGQWVPVKRRRADSLPTSGIKVTPVKLAGDSTVYVIKDPFDTIAPQPLYLLKPNGVLKQTGKSGTYDGRGDVKRDSGLRGGTDASKDVRNDRIIKANERLDEAGRKLGAAQTEVARLKMKVAEAETAMKNAKTKHEKANADYTQASNNYSRFIRTLDWDSPRKAEETAEMNRLYLLQTEKGMSEIRAKAELGTAEIAYSQAALNASRAEEGLRPLRRAVNSAEQALTAAINSSC